MKFSFVRFHICKSFMTRSNPSTPTTRAHLCRIGSCDCQGRSLPHCSVQQVAVLQRPFYICLKQKTKNHALHTGSIEMLDLVSCINPIIYGVYYFSERNFRPRRTSTIRWGFPQSRLSFLVWFSSTRATRIKLSQPDIFYLLNFLMAGLRRSELF